MKKVLLSQTACLQIYIFFKLRDRNYLRATSSCVSRALQLAPCTSLMDTSFNQNVDNILCCQEVQAVLHLSTFVHLVALIAIIIMTDADKRFKTLRFFMWLLERPRVDLDTEESLIKIV